MIRPILHIVLHFVLPAAAARIFWPRQWRRAFVIMAATILVDLDHLWAHPMYDPNRCSIGFHPLHSDIAIAGYFLLSLFPVTRLVGVGLLLHMGLDASDCIAMGVW